VEESGTLKLLAECMSHEGSQKAPVDVLHLSCHGTQPLNPSLLLETDEGAQALCTPEKLSKELGADLPRLLFLSACMTSEPDKLLNSFSSTMVRMGAPAVLGWGGSVSDKEATRFAGHLYGYLSRHHTVEESVVSFRQACVARKKFLSHAGLHTHGCFKAKGKVILYAFLIDNNLLLDEEVNLKFEHRGQPDNSRAASPGDSLSLTWHSSAILSDNQRG
jgi:hypothetical protein